jgi:hypothetical protein
MIDGVNQNHPANARCDEAGWVKELVGSNYKVIEGEMWRATAHGKGWVIACDNTGTVCGRVHINQ